MILKKKKKPCTRPYHTGLCGKHIFPEDEEQKIHKQRIQHSEFWSYYNLTSGELRKKAAQAMTKVITYAPGLTRINFQNSYLMPKLKISKKI